MVRCTGMLRGITIPDSLVPGNLVSQAQQADRSIAAVFQDVIDHRKIPKKGWSEALVEEFLQEMAAMDTNNFLGNVGVGEREGRCYSSIVARRHFRLIHGIGRSGDVTSVQPKAAGSSMLNHLANQLALDAIHISGIRSCQDSFVIPTATGMAMMLTLLYFKQSRPNAKYAIWSRIDQKSCLKCIITAGLTPLVNELVQVGDELQTDLDGIKAKIDQFGADSIAAVITTTSCFAPRVPDKVEEVALLCQETGIPHLVNNAYGLQSSKCCHLIEQASKKGRLDVFVQSCDKNFLVPVGGAIIGAFSRKVTEGISQLYPGRASATPSIDLLITLLQMGRDGYEKLLRERRENYAYLKEKMSSCADKYGERLLDTPHNQISMAMSLTGSHFKGDSSNISQLGSMLFTRSCSGARVIVVGEKKSIEGIAFNGYGSHTNAYPSSYINVAAAIGMTKEEIDTFVQRLDKCLAQLFLPTAVISTSGHTAKQ